MDNTTIASLVLAGLLLLLLAGGFWIALSLLTVGMVLMGVFTTAPMGSLYSRTDGSTSTTLYVKTSGSGNTGWTAK
jgi:hypothetical protein